PERRLLLGADLPGARPADRALPGAVRDPADGGLARPVARGRPGSRAEDRAAAPALPPPRRAEVRADRGAGDRTGSDPNPYHGAMTMTELPGSVDLSVHGIDPSGEVVRNPSTAFLYMQALQRGDGVLAEGGPLVVDTGRFTGRSPKDKFVVREPGSEERIWWGTVNQPLAEEHFEGLREKVVAHLDGQELYVVDAFAGADAAHRVAVRVVTGRAYHALFAKTMFIEPTDEELRAFRPSALVLHAPEVDADPEADGTRTATFVVLHPTRGEILVGGTFYGGEIKKG